MRQNEYLSSPETPTGLRSQKAQTMPRLNAADAEHMEAGQYEMLGVVEGYLSEPFRRIIYEKIVREKESLLLFVAHEQQVQAAAQKIVRVLNPAYFVHKPLDKTMFE